MRTKNRSVPLVAGWAVVFSFVAICQAQSGQLPRAALPDAVIDLRTLTGDARVNAQWRYSDTQIQHIEHRSVGADLKASGRRIIRSISVPMLAPRSSTIFNGTASALPSETWNVVFKTAAN